MPTRKETKARLRSAADARKEVRALQSTLWNADKAAWQPSDADRALGAKLEPWMAGNIPRGGVTEADSWGIFLMLAEYRLSEDVNRLLHELGVDTRCSECGKSVNIADQPFYEEGFGRAGGPVQMVKRPFPIVYCLDNCRLHFQCAFGPGREHLYDDYDPEDRQIDPCPSSHSYSE
jgi:hypothetical protein